MDNVDTYHGIGKSISARAGLMFELAAKLAEQEKRDAEMRECLLQKAPKELREWLTDGMILACIFRYGFWNGKIRIDDYCFKNTEDTRAKMKTLGKAWKDVVHIRLGTAEPGGIPAYLAAVM